MLTLEAPVRADALELALIRGGLAYLLSRYYLDCRLKYDRQTRPVGLARFVDLTGLASPVVQRRLNLLARVALVFYVIGIGMPLVTALLCLYVVARESLNNSQGAIEHAWNAVAAVLLAQAALYGFQAFNELFRPGFRFAGGVGYDRMALFWSQQAIAAVYFTAALTKLIESRGAWAWHTPRIAIQIVKSTRQAYYTRLDPGSLEHCESLVRSISRHPHWTRLLLGAGLLVELAAPLFLYNRAASAAGGVLLIAFHLVNRRYMRLPFKEQQLLVGIFFLQVPFALVAFIEFCRAAF